MRGGYGAGARRAGDTHLGNASGIPYDALRAQDIVLVSLQTGETLPGEALRPSSDTLPHVCLHQRFGEIGGIAHAHSRHATSWAQACREIPCCGTTHADTFHGVVFLCRALSDAEIADAYEWNTGIVIAEHFGASGLHPGHVPGVLLPLHAPFAWGASPAGAVENAIVVEEIAALARRTEMLSLQRRTAPEAIVSKHFTRKHGKEADYGQPGDKGAGKQ